jgi:nucleotide-binding universal stress UspA family protein
MIRTLLVPLDGSRFAERALTVAVPLALQHSATIVLTTAFALPPLQHPVVGVLPGEAPAGSRVRDEIRAQLERVARRVATKYRVTTATQFREGPIVDELERGVRESDADLVVMASHGRSGASRLWLGSVTDALLRRASVPMLVTRTARPWALTTADEPIFPRVLVALDGSRHAERALADALRLIGDYTCHIVLASVHDAPPAPVSPAWAEEAAHELRERYLKPLAAKHAKPSLTFTARVVVDSDPARALLAMAKKENAFLISLATHGRTGVRRAVIGSVADKVIRGATVPVLVSPAHGEPTV